MIAIIDIGTLIVRTPDTCGDRAALRMQHRPRIAGTRVSVQRIAAKTGFKLRGNTRSLLLFLFSTSAKEAIAA